MTPLPRDVIPFPQARTVAAPAIPAASVLIVSTETLQAQRLIALLHQAGLSCRAVSSIDATVLSLQQSPCEVCCVGSLGPSESVARLADALQSRGGTTQIICLRREPAADEANILPAVGGVEFVDEHGDPALLALVVSHAVQRSRLLQESRRLKRQLAGRNLRELPGNSTVLQTLREDVQRLADASEHLLVWGEPGSGASSVAQAVHDASRRSHRPFFMIDCSVLSAESVEEELFGAARPGLLQHTPGRYEQADGGTLYFHSIEHLALPMQRKLVPLLREQRCEHPVTGERLRSDVRIVCSAEVDLAPLVAKGLFREDLMQEICASQLTLPALRTRKEDLGLIVEHHLRRIALREGRAARTLSLEALKLLQAHHWPGNLTELENVIERACGVDWGQKLTAAMVEPWIGQTQEETSDELPPGLTLREMERRLIEATFIRFGGNREKTARSLQIGIRTLSGKLREYGYPPRGGPGSNIKPYQPTAEIHPFEMPHETAPGQLRAA